MKTAAFVSTGIKAFYARQTPRERRLLVLGATTLLCAFAFWVLEWTWHEYRRLNHALPHAQATLERMQHQAAEFMRLKNQAPPQGVSMSALQEALRLASETRGLALQFESTSQGLRVQGQADAAAFFDLLGGIHVQWGVFPVEMTLEATPSGGVHLSGLLGTERAP